MNQSRLPGFTAEASLGQKRERYQYLVRVRHAADQVQAAATDQKLADISKNEFVSYLVLGTTYVCCMDSQGNRGLYYRTCPAGFTPCQ